MAITASMVKELREMTGAGMMDCKKALNETNGDMDAAVEFLRKNGQAKAEKKASRIAAEGVARAAISADGKTACVIEVNSETDFVAKNETFTSFVEAVNGVALASDLQGGKDGEDIEALLATPFEGATVKEALVEKTATIGEKLSIRRFEKVSGDVAVSYIHGGGRIGVIVAANGASDDAAREALTNIAMQVAAMNPTYISRNDISAEELAKLQEITDGNLQNSLWCSSCTGSHGSFLCPAWNFCHRCSGCTGRHCYGISRYYHRYPEIRRFCYSSDADYLCPSGQFWDSL